ncbi:hypothetical protein DID80_08035, partial [Candidatus Marinamargulisbacteria bacterium SCGC AAA071-K20]
KAILEKFNDSVFVVPMRILDKEPDSKESFQARMALFFEETLEALIENHLLLSVSCKQQQKMETITNHQAQFVKYIKKAKEKEFVRNKLDVEMISGFLMDRLLNQVQYADMIKDFSGCDLFNDKEYRQQWCKSNMDLFFNGILN